MRGEQRTTIRNRFGIAALVVSVFAVGVLPATASDTRVMSDDWIINLGSFLSEFKTDASVGFSGVSGTLIRVEDDLGVEDDKTVVRLDGQYRFNERHSMGFGLWTLSRDGTETIGRQIEFDGNVFDLGVTLESEFDTSWLRLDWRYSLLRTEKGEAGFSAGLSLYAFDASIEGLATVSGGRANIRSEDDLLAPVPTIGMFLNYAFKPNLVLRVKGDFLDIDSGDYEGKVTDTTFLIEWYFTEHVGVGAGMNKSDIDVRNTGEDPYLVDFSQSGLLGYFTFVF